MEVCILESESIKKIYHYISFPIVYIVQETKPQRIMTEITSQVKTNVSGSHHISRFWHISVSSKSFHFKGGPLIQSNKNIS